jgi:hypothetical protein
MASFTLSPEAEDKGFGEPSVEDDNKVSAHFPSQCITPLYVDTTCGQLFSPIRVYTAERIDHDRQIEMR